VLLIYLLEIGAAVSGTIYLRKIIAPPRGARLIVFYLWLVVFVESVGIYPAYAYYSNYTKLGFIEGTLLERNFWWFNIYNVVKTVMLSYFFILQFRSLWNQKFFYILTWFITLTLIIDLLYSGGFFTQYPIYSAVAGPLYLIILILMFHKELIESYHILNFQKSIAFYISIGMLIWHAMVTPLFIYSKYFSRTSPEFVAMHSTILQWANVFLYGIIIVGFWVCMVKGEENEGIVLKQKTKNLK
ncbi:MAG TPA: hypothetical protein VLN46_01285, partial [Gillisia sp.]|nr:hypothetical protein [Gillisia sp.]